MNAEIAYLAILTAISVNLFISFVLSKTILREVRDVARILRRINSLGPGDHGALFCGLNKKVVVPLPSSSTEADGTCVLHVILRPARDEGAAE